MEGRISLTRLRGFNSNRGTTAIWLAPVLASCMRCVVLFADMLRLLPVSPGPRVAVET